MKLENASITLLINQDRTTIEIRDNDAATTFIRVGLTPQQLSEALSRVSHTECSVDIYGIDKVGKTHECNRFNFEITEKLRHDRDKTDELYILAKEELAKAGMHDWTPDKYFGSQDSFFSRGGKYFASVIIRKWS